MVLQSVEEQARLSVKKTYNGGGSAKVCFPSKKNRRGVHRKARKHNTRAKNDRDVTLPKKTFPKKGRGQKSCLTQ